MTGQVPTMGMGISEASGCWAAWTHVARHSNVEYLLCLRYLLDIGVSSYPFVPVQPLRQLVRRPLKVNHPAMPWRGGRRRCMQQERPHEQRTAGGNAAWDWLHPPPPFLHLWRRQHAYAV